MTTIEQCPFCGSADLTAKSETRSITVPYGTPTAYESRFFECATCGEQASADAEEKTVAAQKAVTQSVHAMLDYLNAHGVSTAYFERALRIPQRTANRWKEGKISAAALALLRIIRTFPDLLAVADDNFRPDTQRKSPQAVTTNVVNLRSAVRTTAAAENRFFGAG